MTRSRAPIVTLALMLVAVAVGAAGCGGGGKSPAVASLGTGQTTTTATGSGSQSSLGPPAGGGGFSMRIAGGGTKFSSCMRSHGVPSFPDPNAQGVLSVNSSSGIDPRSPKFQAAQRACSKDLPNGGQPTPQQLARIKQQALAMSACMRKHGVPDFPDPTFSAGGVSIRLRGGPGSDLDPSSPAFQRAQQTCRGKGPFGGK